MNRKPAPIAVKNGCNHLNMERAKQTLLKSECKIEDTGDTRSENSKPVQMLVGLPNEHVFASHHQLLCTITTNGERHMQSIIR